ncbi:MULTISPECIES: HutD family protein [unclassified Lentimicrobium]|uniref:HutD family protein n=1 Tax=unclassified Lentimicrobium TaxID=2677434 RepID=UPI001555221A|nr:MULTISPECIES: HutD family protein [unclassified Lentimicrobium]NPD44389.1 hypothetical protein [Lentimicrobium sp. S6]NPD84345.1 hypothetical protein [Lentimicrobium sp. L6]
MHIEHTKAPDLITNNWSGGTTTQLAIFPKNANYKKQNFLFRISTATVETEESSFTKLPNVARKLIILDGEIKIDHENHHSKTIKKFEQDAFSGDWNTKSYGKATDFNLMLKGECTGEIEAITFHHLKSISLKPNFKYYGFYIFKGETKLSIQDQSIIASKGEVISIYSENEIGKIDFKASLECEMILCRINY